MTTCDHPSELVCLVEYPSLERPGLEIDCRFPAFLARKEKRLPLRSNLQGKEVDNIFYFVDARPRNPWTVIASYVFLSVLLLALIVIPLFHTDPLPKSQRMTMLYLQPPPAAGGNAAKLQLPKPESITSSKSMAIPAPVQKTQEAPPPSTGTTGALIGGVPGGIIGGLPGGLIEVPAVTSVPILARTPEPKPVTRIRVASRIAEANLIHDVAPQYPLEAGRERIEGTVVLMAAIGKDGSVQDVQVVSGLPLLTQAAIDAVKQWRYKPYLLNGEPVEIDSRITINFTLSKG
jgi:periplasmic protein TonB